MSGETLVDVIILDTQGEMIYEFTVIKTCKIMKNKFQKYVRKGFTYGHYKSLVTEILAEPLPVIFFILSVLSSPMLKVCMTYKPDFVKSAFECPYTSDSVIMQP